MIQFDEHIFQMDSNHQLVSSGDRLIVHKIILPMYSTNQRGHDGRFDSKFQGIPATRGDC